MPPTFSERWGTGRLAVQYSYYHDYRWYSQACACGTIVTSAHLIFCIAFSSNLRRKIPFPLKNMEHNPDRALCPSPYTGLDLIKWEYNSDGRGVFVQKTRCIIMVQRKFRRLQGRKKVECALRKIFCKHIIPSDLMPTITRFITG